MQFLRNPELRRFGAIAAIAVAGGLGATFFLLPPPPPDFKLAAPPELRVAGEPLPQQGDPIANAIDLVRRYGSGELTLVLPDGRSHVLKRSLLGAEIDRVRVAEFVRAALTPGSPLRRAHEAKNLGGVLDVPIPIALTGDEAIRRLIQIKGEIDASPSDAYVDLQAGKLKPEKIGYRLDVYGTLARIDGALRRGESKVEASVEVITPKKTAASLGHVKFDSVLGYFETRYSRGDKYRDRTYNLRLAASKLDGTVLLPGEVFDFNAVVGPRDEASGYRVAPVIAQGELVDGLGGGTCQISGTLHGAALFAGLEIVERYPHSRPSYYIKLGLDATVVYPTINFRIKNPFDFPVVLHETVSDGIVRAEVLGPQRKLTVTFFRRVDGVMPFEEIERETAKLPEGKRVLAQRGIPGFKTTISRVVRDGAYATRERWTDTYPPTPQIVNVGTGPRDADFDAHDDNHPEYVADEYLVITQGPDIKSPGSKDLPRGGGTVESREPGRTGEHGWTERAGFAAFKSASSADESSSGAPAEGRGSEGAEAASLETVTGSGDASTRGKRDRAKEKSKKDKAEKADGEKSAKGDKKKKRKKKPAAEG